MLMLLLALPLAAAGSDYSFRELLPVNRVAPGGELVAVFPPTITGWYIALFDPRLRRLVRVSQVTTYGGNRLSLRFTVPAALPAGLYVLHLQCDQFEKEAKIYVE